MEYKLLLFDEQIEGKEKSSVDVIVQSIKQSAYSFKTEEEIRLLIQNHQVALIEYKKFEELHEQSDEVLFFLETYFFKYLDDNLPISDKGKEGLLSMPFLNVLRESLKTILDPKLFTIIGPLLYIEKQSHCTVYYAQYLKEFYDKWQVDPPAYEEEAIIKYLLTYNYNSPFLFDYLTISLMYKIDNESSLDAQLEVLTKECKSLLSIPKSNSISFYKDFPSIREMFIEWVRNEMKQTKKRIKERIPNQLPLFSKEQKIETSLSVAQTAYFIKLLYNAGIMTNKVQGDILQVISKTVRSKRTEEISFDSLHNKYYNIEDKTRASLKIILQDLIKSMN